ncbi:ATP synthase F1 subunit delta [Cytophaga hutchinsonii]|jgi:F-type H+-transporting ATPase subunit delta|uniref:ATP synthase subunit delta n=1 Tax=Cytophaga hutchinsonii (strain ATCC 33406 / DSM 1761 / CIP 103989 / NBRC 15051 / NCIMB 9469 / D465) TaxID=269798 RepID=ATPD_CYTH3|nr:ATP synthase F1 subunit delta [Cytophaga hutchinsonii]Q11YP2.1 RecName: Full=ATP synthase subunit delta; AltName: Full=ATP synthase F(1) sector subunit delta; AltName: Full=F-type ATPase subunit delta; Short=F-ATPase subunit delta [Cytophaga hutchinsonii ATCC 33406]ABG57474.1 ATP synthase F1 subcomplex delta subunit [Cytophaga hutchinsonii ATCC 33406]SFW98262.1 ATP synthase F1 subcomplex delta subunit [Cytophaga hutchinsonii ATCC 33406]
MKETRVAYRYAKSLIDLAAENGVLDRVNADMAGIESVFKQNHQLVAVMKNPIVQGDKKHAILEALFGGKVDNFTMSLLSLLTKKHREAVVFEISSEFQRQYREKMGIKIVEVTTTQPITEDQRANFKAIMASKASKVELIEKIDEKILGGFVLKMDDQQIDESVIAKLNKIKNKFTEQVINY